MKKEEIYYLEDMGIMIYNQPVRVNLDESLVQNLDECFRLGEYVYKKRRPGIYDKYPVVTEVNQYIDAGIKTGGLDKFKKLLK